MSKTVFHILNGDALNERFPTQIKDERIIMRTCLMEGSVNFRMRNTVEEFFNARAKQLAYSGIVDSTKEYLDHVYPEIEKILSIPTESKVCLWFEKDVFCQINFWFVCHLIQLENKALDCYLASTNADFPYSFAHHSDEELISTFENQLSKIDVSKFAQLWYDYRNSHWDFLKIHSKTLYKEFPFLEATIEAIMNRIPNDQGDCRLWAQLRELSKELESKDIDVLFKAFSTRYQVYGMGDLQFKSLYQHVFEESN